MNYRRMLLTSVALTAVSHPFFRQMASTSRLFLSSSSRSSSRTIVSTSFAEVHLVPMFSDNYGFVVFDKASNLSLTVDPGDGKSITDYLSQLQPPRDLKMVLCTHKHSDHVGGNTALLKAFPSLDIVGTKYEAIPGLTSPVGHGDLVSFGGLEISVFHTPCHTKGHVIYAIRKKKKGQEKEKEKEKGQEKEKEKEKMTMINDATQHDSEGEEDKKETSSDEDQTVLLFTGDTLFVGGCGRFFEGTAADMLSNMDLIAASFPPRHTIVFCAHEYTESNLKFLASVDPEICGPVLEQVKQKRARNEPTVPTTLQKELEYNLFMKCREERTLRLTQTDSAVGAMAALRERKNAF